MGLPGWRRVKSLLWSSSACVGMHVEKERCQVSSLMGAPFHTGLTEPRAYSSVQRILCLFFLHAETVGTPPPHWGLFYISSWGFIVSGPHACTEPKPSPSLGSFTYLPNLVGLSLPPSPSVCMCVCTHIPLCT